MKVLVCGSRNWEDYPAITERLAELPRGTTIIHGGARGADQMAGRVADRLGFEVVQFLPEWNGRSGYNRRAGLERNLVMLDENPDLVIAFWRDGSTGTGHTVAEARKRGIPVEEVRA